MQRQTITVTGLLGLAALAYFAQPFSASLNLTSMTAAELGIMVGQLAFFAMVVERATEIFVNISFAKRRKEVMQDIAPMAQKLHQLHTQFGQLEAAAKAAPIAAQYLEDIKTAQTQFNTVKSDPVHVADTLNLKSDVYLFSLICSAAIGIVLAFVGVRIFTGLEFINCAQALDEKATNIISKTAQTIQKSVQGLESSPSHDALKTSVENSVKAINDSMEACPSKIQSNAFRAIDKIVTGLLLAGGAAGLHPIINLNKHLKKGDPLDQAN